MAYEDDQAVEDLENAAKSVEQIESLREESIKRGEEFSKENNSYATLVMLNHQIVFETILRELLHYFWESYSELRVMSLELEKKTGYGVFKKELSDISSSHDVENALKILKERYKGPDNLEKYRSYSDLEKTVNEKLEELEKH